MFLRIIFKNVCLKITISFQRIYKQRTLLSFTWVVCECVYRLWIVATYFFIFLAVVSVPSYSSLIMLAIQAVKSTKLLKWHCQCDYRVSSGLFNYCSNMSWLFLLCLRLPISVRHDYKKKRETNVRESWLVRYLDYGPFSK